jgi:hypothetical protein
MQSNRVEGQVPTATHLPQPRGNARWRWSSSTSRKAAMAGGAMAAVLGLGAGVAGASSSSPGPASHDRPPGGLARPTVGGRVTALSGDDITVQAQNDKSVTVVYSTTTTFRSGGGGVAKGSTTNASASNLKVGDFVGVNGTKNTDGTVTATTITISTSTPTGARGGPPGHGTGTKGGAPTGGPPGA